MSPRHMCLLIVVSSICAILVTGLQRENLAVRHPCYAINKRLDKHITWTEKLASSQYKVQRDACGQLGNGPACCTHEIVDSYALSLGIELKILFDAELSRLSMLFLSSKQQIDGWFKEYVNESHRLTVSSLETLFGTNEYRANVHGALSTLFDTLSASDASDDNVSKTAVVLFNHLIISSYRRFMTNGNRLQLDEKFEKCLVNKAFDIEALPTQRELLYTLTSGSSLIQIFRTMLTYIDADIQRLKSTATMTSNQCTQRYARETLCPICTTNASTNRIDESHDMNDPLCPNACRYVIKTCFNHSSNPYLALGSIAKGYSAVIKEIERATNELKLVERLSKLHIYLYDMVVNATNSRHTYMQLQTACPHPNAKPFSPILSLPPITSERRDLVSNWNRSLHFILSQLQSSIDTLTARLSQQIITDICANPNYAGKSNQCTPIEKQNVYNFIRWPLSSIPQSLSNVNDAELTRNQLDELKKKMTPIHQMILSLHPKKKYALIEYIPDFEAYDSDTHTNDAHVPASSIIDTYDDGTQGSLSERLYNEMDRQTMRVSPSTATSRTKSVNSGPSLLCSRRSALIMPALMFIVRRISSISP